jgi:hypothetical protein
MAEYMKEALPNVKAGVITNPVRAVCEPQDLVQFDRDPALTLRVPQDLEKYEKDRSNN